MLHIKSINVKLKDFLNKCYNELFLHKWKVRIRRPQIYKTSKNYIITLLKLLEYIFDI